MRASWGWLWGLALAGVAIAPALAESRPHAAFSTRDGLPSDEVNAAVEDVHGFVWLATGDGLARFDGRSFRVFDREQGLEDPFLLNLSIDPDGTMWVGAVGGVWRFDPARHNRHDAHAKSPLRLATPTKV